MSFYQSGVHTLHSGSGIIMQVKFPHEALLFKEVAEQLANFSLGFILNIIILLVFGVIPAWQIILLPIAILPMFFLGAGLGIVISMIGVVASDISKIFTTMLGLVFYITPIIFNPDEKSITVQRIVELNPLTYLVGGPRDLIIYGYIEYPERFLAAALVSFIFFMLAWRLFFVSEDRLIEKLI
jgi:lipopolysaccharide transport system permease protein